MILKVFFITIAILFLLGVVVSLWRKRYFLAANCLVVSFIFGKLAEVKFLQNILRGFHNYEIVILGGLLVSTFFVVDQWFLGKRNYSLYRFLKEKKKKDLNK